MTETPPARSLHRKLAQIIYEAERIPKRGKAPKEMGGYPFVQVGDAADYIRKALGEHVITMMPTKITVLDKTEHETKSGGSMTTVDLETQWTLTDGESGETIVIYSYGAGADVGDKYSGKAMTSTMKYALLAGFLLSTGEDSEAGKLPDRAPQRHPGLVDGDPPEDERGDDREPDGLIGILSVSGTQDFNLRQTPTGYVLPFRVREGNKAGQIVQAENDLALALDTASTLALAEGKPLIGQRVTVWGTYTDETFDKKDGDTVKTVGYRVLHLTRIQTPEFILPAPVRAEAEPVAMGLV